MERARELGAGPGRATGSRVPSLRSRELGSWLPPHPVPRVSAPWGHVKRVLRPRLLGVTRGKSGLQTSVVLLPPSSQLSDQGWTGAAGVTWDFLLLIGVSQENPVGQVMLTSQTFIPFHPWVSDSRCPQLPTVPLTPVVLYSHPLALTPA